MHSVLWQRFYFMNSLQTSRLKSFAIGGLLTGLFCLLALLAGLASGVAPALGILVAVAAIGVIFLLNAFDYSILGLLILRSTIDTFYAIQLPSIFAVGLDAIAIAYVVFKLLSRKTIQTDGFLFFFGGWCAFQSLWVVLLFFGGLGGSAALIGDSIREIVRLGSWFLVYLLIMQFKGRINPKQFAKLLLLSLAIPLLVALLQLLIPDLLPPEISPATLSVRGPGPDAVRVRGTIGHPNGFATFLFFFIGVVYWKFMESRGARLWWAIVLLVLGGFYVTTKSLFSLGMLGIFMVGMALRKTTFIKLFSGVTFFGLVLLLFASSPIGQERLASIAQTPLLNPDIDASRAIILSTTDYNSFNWRIAQWTDYLTRWQQARWFGHGIGVSVSLSPNGLEPHNDYVRWLYEQGIVGFSGVMVFFGAQFYRLSSLLRSPTSTGPQKNLCYVLIVMLLALLFGMLTENIWDHTMLFFYWWVLFAVSGWDWQEQQEAVEMVHVPKPSGESRA